MEILNEIIVERPIEEVFNFLSNFENMPKWNYYVLTVNKTTEGEITKGSIFHQVRKNDAQDLKVIEFEFPKTVAIATLPPERHLTMRFQLSQEGLFTRIEDVWQVKVSWIVAFFIRHLIQSAVGKNLKKLKTLMEKGEVTLQDGRVTHLR
ncbi:MAG TPA: SRPBCC family protein [Puia sp.]|nr:SRPBCC family protein [Puia sp.]